QEPHGRICALTPAEVLTVPIEDLQKAMRKDEPLMLNFMQRLIAETDWLREAVMGLARLNSRDRIIYYFGQMRRRQIAFGKLDPQASSYEMPITQRHLATMVGISDIHANRLTRDLDDSGLLTLRSKTITIPDVELFEETFETLTVPL
ncbi:MAG: Crp/Fnr family transcriptional regulator, partial [Pontixanthobacter sp.]